MEEKIKTKDNDLDVMADYLIELIIKEMTPGLESDIKSRLKMENLNIDEKELTRFLIEKFREDPTNKKEIHDAIWEFCHSILSSINPRLGSLTSKSDGYWDLKAKEKIEYITKEAAKMNLSIIPLNKLNDLKNKNK